MQKSNTVKNFLLLLLVLSNFICYGQQANSEITIPSLANTVDQQLIKNDEIKELERFKKFKKRLDTASTNRYLENIRTYSKDSLKTLAIKLISIKELKEKKLLRKDIKLNLKYYTRLLDELQSSEISVNKYLFLEQELAHYRLNREKYRFRVSIGVNIILFFTVMFLLSRIYSIRQKRNSLNIEVLSQQEFKIKECIVDGKSNKEIAEELFISLSTVKTHITNIYHKLQVSNRKELLLKFKK